MKSRAFSPATITLISLVCIFVIAAGLFMMTPTTETFYAGEDNIDVVNAVESIVKKYSIKSICDMACGDGAWVPLLLKRIPTLKYTGYDNSSILVDKAKENLKGFEHASVHVADPMTASPAPCDLVLSLNYLQTLSYNDIKKTIEKFAGYDCKFYALGNYDFEASNNTDIETGKNFLINLEKHPFNMSPAFVETESKKKNRVVFVYSSAQMKGYIQSNGFWTSGMR
jgi:hypothetical protein